MINCKIYRDAFLEILFSDNTSMKNLVECEYMWKQFYGSVQEISNLLEDGKIADKMGVYSAGRGSIFG